MSMVALVEGSTLGIVVGAVVCAGETITCAWKQAQSDGGDFLEQAVAAAERMKKNLTRYVTIL